MIGTFGHWRRELFSHCLWIIKNCQHFCGKWGETEEFSWWTACRYTSWVVNIQLRLMVDGGHFLCTWPNFTAIHIDVINCWIDKPLSWYCCWRELSYLVSRLAKTILPGGRKGQVCLYFWFLIVRMVGNNNCMEMNGDTRSKNNHAPASPESGDDQKLLPRCQTPVVIKIAKSNCHSPNPSFRSR